MDPLSDHIVIILTAAFALLLTAVYRFLNSKNSYWKDRNVPYVEPSLGFGNTKDQILGRKSVATVHENIYCALRAHRFGGFFQLTVPMLMIRDPALVQRILVKDFRCFYNRGFTVDAERDPLTANLFLLEGKTWRNLRYKLTPTFSTGRLKGMFEQIGRCSGHAVSYIEELSETGAPVEANTALSGFTLDVIAHCAFGLQIDKDDEMNVHFRKAFGDILKPTKRQLFKSLVRNLWPNVGKKLGLSSLSKQLQTVVIDMVKDTLKYREENNVIRNDFLQLMLNMRKEESGRDRVTADEEFSQDDDVIDQMKHLSPEETAELSEEKDEISMTDSMIAAQAFVFLIAGAETVSSTITFALYCLSRNTEVQGKVRTEIDSALERSGGRWSYQVVKELTYLEQVIQETLRMYPIAPQLFRICTEPYRLPDTDCVIEAGTRIVIPVYSIHNDPLNYEAPEVFDPDRFAGNNFKPSGRYMPFGDGPRICIGMRFAILEVQLMLARLLERFTVRLSNKTSLPIKFHNTATTLQAQEALWFHFEKR